MYSLSPHLEQTIIHSKWNRKSSSINLLSIDPELILCKHWTQHYGRCCSELIKINVQPTVKGAWQRGLVHLGRLYFKLYLILVECDTERRVNWENEYSISLSPYGIDKRERLQSNNPLRSQILYKSSSLTVLDNSDVHWGRAGNQLSRSSHHH